MRSQHYAEIREQAERMELAQAALKAALARLAETAKRESRKGTPDVDAVLGLVGEVKRTEEAFDLACLDLQTARGEDA